MQELLNVFDVLVQDRKGVWTSIWMVYEGRRVVTVEFTRGTSGITSRVHLTEVV